MKKFKIYPFDPKFSEIFEEKKKKICEVIKNCDIHHIGSTAVPGLGGKGIIDIMIGINNWKESKEIVEKLKSIGFIHVHPKENGRIFLANKKESGIGDFHIHITKKGEKIYNDILSFRDYLIKNKKEVPRFYKLKIKWHTESRGDRVMYGKLKGEYIKEIMGNMFKKLLEEFRELNLPDGEYAIYGSGSMAVRNIKSTDDLDVIVIDTLYQELKKKYPKDPEKERIVIGEIEIYPIWYWDPKMAGLKESIENAELINGLRFILLTDLIKWKKKMVRTKDFEHIKMIEDYFEQQKLKN